MLESVKKNHPKKNKSTLQKSNDLIPKIAISRRELVTFSKAHLTIWYQKLPFLEGS